MYEKGNKFKNIQGKLTLDYDICTRNKSGIIKKTQTNFGSKWDEITRKYSWQHKNR